MQVKDWWVLADMRVGGFLAVCVWMLNAYNSRPGELV